MASSAFLATQPAGSLAAGFHRGKFAAANVLQDLQRLDLRTPLHSLRPHRGPHAHPSAPVPFQTESLISCQSASSGNGAVTAQESRSESTDNGAAVPVLEPGKVGERLADAPANGTPTFKARVLEPEELFFVSEADGTDLDQPTPGFDSIKEAVEAIRQGKFVLVVDDENRENEGDLIMAASHTTPEDIAFMLKHTTGYICVGMKGDMLDRLELPLMVKPEENEEVERTAFTVTVDAKQNTSTGISASDRANTLRALCDPDSKPEHFRRPGHILPLRYREGGVLKRAGHTEAAVDLADLAGLPPAGALCEVVTADKLGMARLPELKALAAKENLPLISISDLVRYKRKREQLVVRTAVARLPTEFGRFQAYAYRSKIDGIEHTAIVKGDIGDGLNVLVRVHSECLTGDIFASRRCDCGNQLHLALRKIEEAGRGVVVYLRGQEGRGIGLGHKLLAYNLQDKGRDTVEANVDLGLPIDSREYGVGAHILRDIGVRTMRLMTNNPAKFQGLRGYGLAITERVPVTGPINADNERYMTTKRIKMGHFYGESKSLESQIQRLAQYNSDDESLNPPS
ncbi:Bifunctional GTP cyclohydrolase II/3,4-dihydroxy-2butanone-4-phosphate synthase [Klebsormidium nitens]|uniref:Bifunctional GTP cyclohydrolase II/3,4-dihydroxy-2butanone-4-phosphate synthase n=1 Tax=Klebsormidium nitens TaxID=105231 RepID=A0A1Y1ICR4_KLENI|nr:Bifunctional GTP cyclohydrolase II/3,4-dihydroxy-2butanone-4-phosphate synthase [Klebsormidium nitens]|eukprot:GAQ86506.1 Bifunctional GTP cyclohydrolase II/3,4-dihydroxy-2butanone-4-phosphate synthase [Klebsormidium nitens]